MGKTTDQPDNLRDMFNSDPSEYLQPTQQFTFIKDEMEWGERLEEAPARQLFVNGEMPPNQKRGTLERLWVDGEETFAEFYVFGKPSFIAKFPSPSVYEKLLPFLGIETEVTFGTEFADNV